MPIGASAGTLDIENATLRSNAIAVLTNLVAGNDQVRQSGPPALEVYGDPSHGGNEARLELVSNLSVENSKSFTRLTSNAGVFSIETGTSGTSDNGTITFGGFQNERLRITSDGKVGVGTDSPSAPLHIGDYQTGSAGEILRLSGASSADRHFKFLNEDDAAQGGVGSNAVWVHDINSSFGQYAFRNGANGGTELMRIKNNGNVGVGMDDPQQKLEVHGNILLGQNDIKSFIHGGSSVAMSSDTHVLFVSDSNDTSGAAAGGDIIFGSGSAINTNSNRDFTFAQAYPSDVPRNEHMRILGSNGNVGIGWTNPTEALQIYRNGTDPTYIWAIGNTSDRAGIVFSEDVESKHAIIEYDGTGSGVGNYIAFYSGISTWTSKGAGLNFVPANGRVGINDTTPSYALDVNGTINATNVSPSDDRIKYNEQGVSNALTLISQLNPQKYEKIMERPNPCEGTWIPTDGEWENVKEDYTYGDEFGFIAQDVRAVPELAFLVHGEETRSDTKTSSPEEYSNLTTEEQLTYTTSYTYESNTITQEEYSNLSPEEQGLYSTQYTKQIETQTPLALNYQGLFVVAIGAIKELKAKNDDLEARITALESA